MFNLFNRVPRIEVFVRHCHYSAASAHKARLNAFSKESCYQNLLNTADDRVNFTFLLDAYHPMETEHFLRDKQPIVEFKAGSEAGSFLWMLEHVLKRNFSSDTIIYFLEDDYIHKPNWANVLREAFTLPNVDYVTLYDHKDKYFFSQYEELKSKIFVTPTCHWRTTPSTTNTYAMKFKTLKKHIEIHRLFSLGRTITSDHDKFCKLSEEGAVLISSIPGWATHAEPDYASPCADWESVLSSTLR